MRSLDNQILKLLSNNDVTFFIPPYQRNYEWGEEMCEILLKDIEKVANSSNAQHFFGTIIYYSESTILGQPDKYILVDGQQRLTTTMLFLIAARDCLTDDTLKNTIDSKYLKNNNVNGDVEFKIKLKQVESDWKAYKNIILGGQIDDIDKKSIVFKNYKFFKSKLEKLEQNKIRNLIEKGLVNFNIVTIQLEPERNQWEKPQEIFESMNSLGKPLSLADLVRNYLLLGKSSEIQENLYHNFWLRIEQNLIGDNNLFSVSSFIRDYMQLIDVASYKKATESNYKELYRNFKELFGNENHDELIKRLAEYSNEYAIIAGYKSSGNIAIDQRITDLRTLKVSAFHSFILGTLHFRAENRISDEDCLAILDAIFVYVARKSILGIRKSENRDAALLANSFDELFSANDKKNAMLTICANQAFSMRLPNDGEIRDYLLSENSNFYNFESARFFLSLIEEKLTKNRPSMTDQMLQVEHIMPQTLNEIWKIELGANYKHIHDNYLNNIGNLTLIRHNQELKNQAFKEKRDIYENYAGLQITKNKIIDKQNWGLMQIQERAQFLVSILVEKVLPVGEEFKTSNNYSIGKKTIGNKLSFLSLDLIGKSIVYFDDATIVAEVVGDKLVKFENKEWRLSPLTREIETRKNRRNSSGAYWGVYMWKYNGKTLVDMMNDFKNNKVEENEDE